MMASGQGSRVLFSHTQQKLEPATLINKQGQPDYTLKTPLVVILVAATVTDTLLHVHIVFVVGLTVSRDGNLLRVGEDPLVC